MNKRNSNNAPKQLKRLLHEIKEKLHLQPTDRIKPLVNEMEERMESIPKSNVDLKFQALSTLATYYKNSKNYDKAASYYRQALLLVNKLNPSDGMLIIDTYLKYVALEREYKQEKKARIHIAKLLEWLDHNRPDDYKAYGLAYSNLGKLFIDEEDLKSGVQHLEKALAYFKKAFPSDHPLILETIQAISAGFVEMKDFENARLIYEAILKDMDQEHDRKTYGKIILKIAEVYYYTDLKKAYDTLLKAKQMFNEQGKESEADLLKTYLMLGEIEEHVNLKQAVKYYEKALDFIHNDSLDVVVYAKISMLSIKLKDDKKAKKYLEKGLSLSKENTRIRTSFLYGLGKIYSKEKNLRKANVFYTDLLELLDKNGSRKSKDYADISQAIGYNYFSENHWDQAITYYDKAVSIYEQFTFPGYHEEKAVSYMQLATCHEAINSDVNTIVNYYQKALQAIEKTDHKEIKKDILSRLISLSEKHDLHTEKEKYNDQLIQLQSSY